MKKENTKKGDRKEERKGEGRQRRALSKKKIWHMFLIELKKHSICTKVGLPFFICQTLFLLLVIPITVKKT